MPPPGAKERARHSASVMTAAMRRRNKAHGVGNVNLYGMEQHPRMLHTIMVKAGQYTVSEDIPPDSVAVGTAAPMPMRRRFWTSWRAAASRGALVAWRQVA